VLCCSFLKSRTESKGPSKDPEAANRRGLFRSVPPIVNGSPILKQKRGLYHEWQLFSSGMGFAKRSQEQRIVRRPTRQKGPGLFRLTSALNIILAAPGSDHHSAEQKFDRVGK